MTLILILFMSVSLSVYSQTTETITTTGTWTCPDGVTSIDVEVWGAGGGGGGGNGTIKEGGGGGGGGGYSKQTSISVTPGVSYNITVGTGGTGTTTNGNPGGTSSATFGATTVSANGGSGGSVGPQGAGGSGGTGSTYNGGSGATAPLGDAGGGGEGACTTGNGNPGSGSTGGSGCDGGNGGDGQTSVDGDGYPGETAGGGGGGGTKNGIGGAGADGEVKITYTCPTNNSPNAGLNQTLAACETSTTLTGNEPDYGTGTWTVESGTATITNPNDPETTVTGLVLGTTVTMRWTFSNAGCGSSYDDMTITTSEGPGCWNYCASGWTNLTDDYISNVSFGSINNASVANTDGYGNYTSQTTNVLRGSTYQLCVDIYVNGAYTQHCFAYFDWNNDGDLLDAGESYDLGETSGTGQLCTDITIPAGATLGETRMRIIEKYNADPTGPCETGTYGETEDYTINIYSPPVIVTDPTNQSICYNSSADFNVIVSGTPPYTYQWQYQGSNVADGTPAGAVYSGANTSTLTVSGAITAGTYSSYTCYVTNAFGNVTSAGADLIISSDVAPDAPTDLTKSEDMICSGESVTLGATVSSGVLEWYTGSCSGTLVSSPVSPTETTTYYAKAYDSGTGCYSACSEITVNVMDDIIFIEEPEDQYGCAGESLSFSVIATGAGLTYQWQEDSGSGFADITDGGVYSGATTMHLVISDVTGLDGNDYQCVVTGSCDTQTSASATLNEISSGLSGTYTVGTAGDYTTLKAAFDDINVYGLSGDTYLKVISNTTETAEASLNEWVDCAGNSGYTVTIYPTGATRTISGNIATSLVTLNGADNVTIDGRLDMTGTENSLVFSNSNTSGATLEFTNAACNNTVQYATIRGATVSETNGVVYFGTAGATGNNNNTIMECDIRDDATEPLYGIYSKGTAGKPNSDNYIYSCNIYNFFEYGFISRGIFLYTANTRWTLTGNSLYQTNSRTDGAFYGISINDSNGGEFMIEENYIGGTAPLCGGSPMTYNYSSYGIMFEGIIITCNSVGVSVIQDNVIQNIDFNSAVVTTDGSQYVIWTGIDIWAGRVDVIGNTIGDDSTGSINISIDNDLNYPPYEGTAWNNGIWHNGEGNVIDNSVGSITFDGTISTQCGFNAIEYVGTMISDQMITGNTVGHATTANSIQFASGTTPAMTMGGIYFGTDGDFLTTVARNTVANINNGCTASNSFLVALNNQATAGNQIIKGNEIYDISTASQEIGSYSTPTDFPAFAGIRTNNTAAGADLTIDNNHIYNISSTTGSADVSLFGVYCATATSGTHVINGNNIHSFSTQNTSSGVWQKGLVLESGTATISNNMIRLGVEGINSDNWIVGLETATASSNSVLFNTAYIGGTATSTRNTESFYRSGSGTADVRNNIFVNARTGGSGYHYAYYLSTSSSLTSDNNIYWDGSSGVTAYDGSGAVYTLAAIQTATGGDNNSDVTDPLLVAPTGTGTACDLHIQSTSPAIGAAATGTGITTDIDNQTRATTPCIGADEYVTAPYGTDVYGIYTPDGINGTIEDVEIVSEGGAPGGTGYNVADPNVVHWPNVYITDYHVITASNLMCTNSEFTFTTEDGTPNWLFGNGAIPSSATTTPATSYYESTGYKDIIESVKVFNDFININMESPDPGSILGAPTGSGCPTTYTYTSSEAGSSGYLYEWYATAPSGCQVSIENATASSTDITFVNQTGVDQIFLVTLIIETECCGKLKPVERYITIYPGPKMPEINGGPFSTCEGGSQEVFILNPNPEYSFEWFDAETGGTQLGSGTSFTFTNIPVGTNSYWVQSTNSFGCSSQRKEIVIEGITPEAPSVDNQSTCGDSDVTFYINSPQAGYIYNWYTNSCGGTLLQSSTSTSFTYNVTSTETFYVSAVPPGCAEGNCATPAVSYYTPPDPVDWEGDDAISPNDWFVEENWKNNCLPNCGTNVRIGAGLSNYPEIGFHPDPAAAKNMELVNGASLTFTDSKAHLELCGDFTHAGSLVTNDYGTVSFIGSTAQQYIKSETATGEFNNVRINNSATTPTLTLTAGDMIISQNGTITFINGTVVTGDNKLVLKNTATNAIDGFNADRYVNGNLRRHISTSITDYAFPVGVSSRYALAELKNNSLTGVTYLDAKFLSSFTNTGILDPAKATDGAIIYDYIASEGIWQIDADAGPTGGSYDIALWFNDGGYGTFAGLIDNQFAPLKRPSTSTLASDWTALGGTATLHAVANGYAKRSGWSAFSQYAIGYQQTPLPIELLTFYAKYKNNVVNINWETASEINNDYYIVQKSTDAINFINIDKINSLAPGGNSNSLLKYVSFDKDVDYGIFYYRLKQYDLDGSYTYSNIVSVIINQNGTFTVHPNPTKDVVEISYYCNHNEQPIVKLYDERGKLVTTQQIECIQGANKTIIDLSMIAPSVYTLILITKDSVNKVQLIKQ
ncbi:MAG: GEVED domain-containing protein [Bacteroidales bacterium]